MRGAKRPVKGRRWDKHESTVTRPAGAVRTRQPNDPHAGVTAGRVESILKRDKKFGVLYYLIRWEKLGESGDTWEPIENLRKQNNWTDLYEAFRQAGRQVC